MNSKNQFNHFVTKKKTVSLHLGKSYTASSQ